MTTLPTIITHGPGASTPTAIVLAGIGVLTAATSGATSLSALGDADCPVVVWSFEDGTVILTIECEDAHCVALQPLWRSEWCASTHSVAQSGVGAVEHVPGDLVTRECRSNDCSEDETHMGALGVQPNAFEPVAMDLAVTGRLLGDDDALLIRWSCVWDGEILSYSVANFTGADQLVSWEGTPLFGQIEVPAGIELTFGIAVEPPLTVESRTLTVALQRNGATTFEGVVATIVADTCPWDLNGNDVVNPSDLIILLGAWGTDPGGPPDFNGDGVVNPTDLIELLGAWGPCP